MLSISQCLTIAIAVATVVVNNLNSKKKNPMDFES
jgi:hypothetical protein